jgi:hypothetical protein
VVNISAIRREEETPHDTLEARPSITPFRFKFSFVFGRCYTIKNLSAINSRYIFERAECTCSDSVTSILPRFSANSNTKGHHIALDSNSHSLDPLWYQPCLYHPVLVPSDVLDCM